MVVVRAVTAHTKFFTDKFQELSKSFVALPYNIKSMFRTVKRPNMVRMELTRCLPNLPVFLDGLLF